MPGHLCNQTAPGFHFACANLRFGDVINYRVKARNEVERLKHKGKVARIDQEFKRKIATGYNLKGLEDLRAQDPLIVREVLQHWAQAQEFRVLSISLELPFEPRIFHV